MENYPSNSRTGKEEPKEPKEPKNIEKVVSGRVIRRKKPLGRRFVETFIGGGDSASVWQYVLYDVLVPAAKDTVSDAVSQGIERMLFGESRGRNSPRSRASSSYTSYQRYSTPSPLSRREDPRRDGRSISRQARATHDFDEIVLETRREVEDILDRMFAVIQKYEEISVSDLYEMLGVHAEFTDAKWGWTSLDNVGATKVRNGYLLDLPRPEPLN